MKVLILFIILGFALPLRAQSAASDTSRTAFIRTISGSEYFGDLLRETSDSVFLIQYDGVLVQLPRNGIDIIKYGQNIPLSYYPNYHFWEGGVVLGTPGGVNILAGYEMNFGGIRISGGYFNDHTSGIQLNLLLNLYRGENISHALSLVWANINTPSPPIGSNAIGLAYDLNLYGFSFELGLAKPSGADNFVDALIQLGYVCQFR